MTPPVARVAARIQVGILVSTVPVALVAGGFISPFDWRTAAIAAIGVMVSAIFLSALFIPFAGLFISWMGVGKAK